MRIVDLIRKEAVEYSKDADLSGNPPDLQDKLLTDAVRVAYVMGAEYVIKKWEKDLTDYVWATADTKRQAMEKLKELGII